MDTFDTTPSTDFSDLDDLEADPGAQPRDDIDTSLPIDSIVRDTLINRIFDAPVTLIPKAIEAITEKSESQKEYESYTPEQQGAINQAFSATGISGLANKNPVSLFGKGALETAKESLDQRINNVGIDDTTLELNNFIQTLGGDSDARIDEAVANAEAKAKAEKDVQDAIAEAEAKAKADRDAEVESRRQLEARIDANRRAAAEDYGGGNGGGAGGGQDAGAYGGGAMRGRGDNF
jgi:hypothetical protein